ncbi:Copper/zinc superoxide dismutase, partial [Monkeypox virus]
MAVCIIDHDNIRGVI